MSNPSPPICPACGSILDVDSTGACPRCLMLAAMVPTAHSGEAMRQPAPAIESVAAAFPQLEILELIGQGGMGCVFKARQPKLNRFVALKLLPASLAERDAAFAGRFEREGQLLARLHHPNIVAVHDSGFIAASQLATLNSQPGFYYLIMEYVDGVNLRQAMRARRFTPGQALAIVPHICDALQFAHEEGVLHRDIKPENILLDAKGRVKLADFGIAKLLGSDADAPIRDSIDQAQMPGLTQSGTALGTPSYMAPEQRDTPADVDHRADIYSLGVVFYELLTGELPQSPLARPSEKSAADPRVDAIVQQAMEKERDRRQQSVGDVRTQVETITGSPTLAALPDPERPLATNEVSLWSTRLPYLGLFAVLAGLWWTHLWWHDPVEGRSMRPVGVIVAVVGLFLMLKGLIQAGRSPVTQPAAASAASPVGNLESRFSRTAIWAASWILLCTIVVPPFIWHELETHEFMRAGPFASLLMCLIWFVFLIPAFAAPLGATLLGWIAVTQIRRSAGKLHGLWLAVFDGLLFPLLLLGALIGYGLKFAEQAFVTMNSASEVMNRHSFTGRMQMSSLERFAAQLANFLGRHEGAVMFALCALVIVVWILIIRRVWRVVQTPDSKPFTTSNGRTKRVLWFVAPVAAVVGVLIWLAAPKHPDYVLTGRVTDSATGLPLSQAIVAVTRNGDVLRQTTVNGNGSYQLRWPEDADLLYWEKGVRHGVQLVIRASAPSYEQQTVETFQLPTIGYAKRAYDFSLLPLKKPDAAGTPKLSFGPVIEREIPFGRASLNFATGILTPLPGMALAAQARREHGDVFQPASESNTNALAILDARVLDLDEAAWTNLSATALEEKFAQDAASRRASQGQSQTRIPPGVYGFKTHDKTGLMQVMGLTGSKPGQFSGVMLRYKLLVPVVAVSAPPVETTLAGLPDTASNRVAGRLVDYQNKPVADATLFIPSVSEGGQVYISSGKINEPSGTNVTKGLQTSTDADGRFTLTLTPESAHYLIITAPTYLAWIVPAIEPGKETLITLPKPAAFVIRYDVPGGPETAKFDICLDPSEVPGWKDRLYNASVSVTIRNGRQTTVANLPPGVYDIQRRKQAGNADVPLDWPNRFVITAGESKTADFTRRGEAIHGTVADLRELGLSSALISVTERLPESGPPATTVHGFDIIATGPDGAFETEQLPPGNYTLSASAELAEPGRLLSSDSKGLRFTGRLDISVPAAQPVRGFVIPLTPGGIDKKSAQSQDRAPGYSAVVEATLPDGEMIDFETGKIVSWADMPQFPKDRTFNEEFWTAFAKSAAGTKDAKVPEPTRQTDDRERDLMMHAWMQQHGLDAFYEMHDDKNLINLGMTVVPMDSENWDKLTAYHLHTVLAAPPESRVPPVRLPAGGKEMPGPANGTRAILWADGFPTYAFRTREGGEGLLQITGYGKERRNLKLRYKLTSAAFQKQLTAPASFESVTGGAQALFTMIIPHPANIGVSTADEFTAQHATQEFEIHTQFKTGEVAQKAVKQTGPSATGFMLTVQRLKAPLVSAAADLPQFLDRPYWKSYVNSSFDPKTGQGVAVYFDFGARLDPDFKKAMLELLQLRDGMVRFSPVQAKAPVEHPPQHAKIPDDADSLAHLPLDIAEHIKAKRNEKLAMTDERMREFITQLAEKFPALRRTDKGTLVRSLAGKSEKGTLQFDFRFPPLTTEGPPIDAPTEATHRVTVVLRPLTPGQAGPYGLTRYGRLGLYGDVIVSAGDSALHDALTKLLRDELAPLAELDGTAMPREMGENYANFATLDDAAKEKLVWNLSEAGSIFRPEHKGICRDLLATQGRYAHANAPSFTSAAIAVAMQQDWREMRDLVAKIYHRPTSSHLYASAFACLRKWDRIPIPAEIVSAAETLHEAGANQTTVKDADIAEATALLLAAQDREAVLVQTIVQALRNPGKGSTKRGWDALVRVLTHLNAMTVRETLKALREEAAMERATVESLEADYIAALAIGPWGEAVDGVQASLRAEREEWWKSELPAFKLKMRNKGEHSPFIARQQEVAEVEFDGQTYFYSGTVDVLSGPIQPGEYFDNIAVTLDLKMWHSKATGEPLALKAGEHTVRVSMGLEVTPSVRVISNPIKINLRETHEPLPPPPPIPPAALEQAKAAQVDLIFYDKVTDGTYRRLTLHAGNFDGPGSEPWDRVSVSAEQLARVLDHLAQTRFFDTAKEYDSLEVAKRQPCYILKVRQHGHEYFENLGWERQTGERLEKLRSVLEGDANAALSKLLAALEPKLREWEDASWSAIQNGLQLRVEAERPIFKVGDNVILRFTFRNTTDRPFTVLDAQDQMRGTFHQFTFTDEKGEDIAQTSTPDPAWENKGIGEIMVRHEIPAHGMISRTVSLSGWNLAGLGHPYTRIGKEARSFNVTGAYFTREGLDLKDPKVWLGHIAAKPVRIEIVENHAPISAASQTADSSPADLAAASARGKASATADIKAGRLRILHSGMPWSQGKPLFDDTTGYRVEPLGGCAETPQFRAELDAYNQTMREWRKQH